MVRESRIKEYYFSNIVTNGSNQVVTNYSDHPINGELLEVIFTSDNTGSLWVGESGTNKELFRRNAPSGAGTQYAYPFVFSQITTGSIAGATHIPFVTNNVLFVSAGSYISGTIPYTCKLKYR